MTPTLLPRTELELLASRMGALGRAARAAFPAARLAFRTTHELWTVCDTGLHVEQPYPGMWGKRSWVAAINAALRHAAAAAGAEVVDLALMAEPFTPRMTTTDNLHYKARWCGGDGWHGLTPPSLPCC